MEKEKAILVLVVGMRPDGLTGCGSDYVGTLLKESRYTLAARTVMPSVTLPCRCFTECRPRGITCSPTRLYRRCGR